MKIEFRVNKSVFYFIFNILIKAAINTILVSKYKNCQATAPLTLLFAASTIVLNAGFKLAPPTKNPSISSC